VAPLSLTVVVPCLNEAENIEAVYAEAVSALDGFDPLEIIFVDDGSTDGSLDQIRTLAARDSRVGYMSFSRNFGFEAAFSAGYRYARQEWVLHLDADLQFPPAEAHRLALAARSGFDAVFGVRVDRQDRWTRRVASRIHDLIARRALGIRIPPGATSFRLIRADLARRVVDLDLGTVPLLTDAWTTVPTAHRARLRGQPKANLRGLARHSVELFMSYSDRPLRAAVTALLLGTGLSAGAFTAALLGAGSVALTLLAAALTGALPALAVGTRYLLHIARGHRGVPRYLIRETNLPVDRADRLGPEQPVGAAR
jgi:glycosyltransferase involved in cell wall biosynthesis